MLFKVKFNLYLINKTKFFEYFHKNTCNLQLLDIIFTTRNIF